MISIDDLSCGYGKEIVLREIHLEIDAGRFVGLIGPNGSGKTTLIRAMSGLLPPRTGGIRLEGKTVSHMASKELAKRVAVVMQSEDTTPPFSVEEFVLMGRIPHWTRFQLLETKQDRDLAQRAMTVTGIGHLKGRPLAALSGGERQLAGLARALAQDPALLLLDEPTAHLDIGHQVQIMHLLEKLNKEGLTIVAVLHDLNLASLYCQVLVLLAKGRVRRVGHPNDVLTREIIDDVYGTSVAVTEDPRTSRPLVFPVH